MTPSCSTSAWPVGRPSRVGVDINQPGDDELAARIDDVARVGHDPGLHRGDAAARNRHIADCVEPNRGIDDAAARDEQVVSRRLAPASLGARANIATPAAAVERNWRLFMMGRE